MIFECSASKEYMELILERISRKVAFSAKVDFLVPEAVPIVPASGQVSSRMHLGHAKGIQFLESATPPMPCLLRTPVLATKK